MRSRSLILWAVAGIAALALVLAPTAHVIHASASGVVISAVYGAGGRAGSTYTHDYIEIFNAGSATVDLTGWSVQYADTHVGSSWEKTFLTGNLAPGQYFLARQDAGTGGTVTPPADATGSASMTANGAVKVALMSTMDTIVGDDPWADANSVDDIEDFFGAGDSAYAEGSVRTGTLDDTLAWFRNGNGCVDTDNNLNDFSAGTAYPNARSLSSPLAPCVSTELVIDGHFEGGTTNWTLSAGASIKCAGFGNGSDCALKMKPKSTAKQIDMIDDALGGTGTAAGDALLISADVRSKLSNKMKVVRVILTYVTPTAGAKGNGMDKIKLKVSGPTAGYESFSKTFTLADSIANGKIIVAHPSTSSKLRVDNVSVLLVPGGGGSARVLPAPSGILPLPAPPANQGNG